MDERGVTELIGYTVIFGIVLLSFSMLFLVGTTSVTDSRERTQVDNAEAAFEILAENVDEHAFDRAVGRATEIKVADASLYFGPEESVNVTIMPDGAGSGEENVTLYDRSSEPIVYESRDGTSVVYANGALFREETDESRMVREPYARIDENRTVLPQIRFSNAEGRLTIGGSETVLVRTERLSPRFEQNTTYQEYDLEITITTTDRRAEAWQSYYDSFEILECPDSRIVDLPDEGAELTCQTDGHTTAEVYVPETRLDGEFS
ncbi:DUF7289 family protein [Natrarchaeobius oligotrophus]|uniref:Uncharacterized protein n=1 Tax=Natrarchaeobius chitinivorans TaxID=1679083 RepID=A0A3N6MIU4_NATCH|nr:hypothetical protein [Natrarchaeobius chitinivorans]RQH03188.1 hypothetical protein EA472_00945 [Natrarchaeobius chitinivorans]